MNQVTAIISLKVCTNCSAKAPLFQTIDHEPYCDGDYVCTLKMGSWLIEQDQQVVIVHSHPVSD